MTVLGPLDEPRVEPAVGVEDGGDVRASRARSTRSVAEDRASARRRVRTSMPSTSASSISNSCAGISCAVLERDARARAVHPSAWRHAPRRASAVAAAPRPRSISSVVRRLGRCPPGGDLAERGAGGVEGHVPAADHQDVVAELDPVPEVRVEQEVDRAQDAVELDAGDLQVTAAHAADAQEDRREPVVLQRPQREVAPEPLVRAQLDPHVEDRADLVLEHVAAQSVGRDAEHHHAARPVLRFEHDRAVAVGR